jgi:dihydroneopterin aldolase
MKHYRSVSSLFCHIKGQFTGMDKITINHIKISTRIGIHPWEQHCPQTLFLNLCFQTNVKKIAEKDAIEHAINYDRVVSRIFAFVAETHFQLIETFADRLADTLLCDFPIPWLELTVHKPGVLTQAKNVSITIERSSMYDSTSI